MPATQRGQAYRLGPHRWGLRYYDANGQRRRKSPFPSKTAALDHYRNVIEPELRGDPVPMPEITLVELVDLFLERHAASVRPRTIKILHERLAYATRAFGDVPLRDLERMSGEIAAWQAKLPERSRYGIVSALRQTLSQPCGGSTWLAIRRRSLLATHSCRRAPSARTRAPRSTRSPPS
jgi:hypothetical protein